MKTTIILLGILFGYFIPKDTFFIIFFLIVIMFLFGFVFPDMMNANSLRNKVDREKVTFKNKITIYKMNTISFWIGVFVFCTGITSVIKYILLTSEINQLGILIITFSLGVFIKLFNTNRTISKLLK